MVTYQGNCCNLFLDINKKDALDISAIIEVGFLSKHVHYDISEDASSALRVEKIKVERMGFTIQDLRDLAKNLLEYAEVAEERENLLKEAIRYSNDETGQ